MGGVPDWGGDRGLEEGAGLHLHGPLHPCCSSPPLYQNIPGHQAWQERVSHQDIHSDSDSVGGFSGLIMFYTGMVSHIKDQFHPAIALLFNMLGVSLLGYLLLTNRDAVQWVKKKIRIHKLVSSSLKKRQSYHVTTFALNKDRRRTHDDDSVKEVEHVETIESDDFLQDDSGKDTTWVGIVKMVNLDQQRGRAVFVNKLSEE